MRKITLFLAALCCCTVMANAERVKSGDLYYEIDKSAKTAIVTYETDKSDGSNYSSLTSVTIYPTIQVGDETYQIIGIGEKAFAWNNTITGFGVTYSTFLKSIGNYAFNYATALKFVSFQSPALESIGDHAFYGCSALTGIDLPSSVKTIDQYAFCNCKAMSKVMIPEGTTTIGTCAFRWCEGLQILRLPSTLTSIGDFAFQNCKALKEMRCHLAAPLDLGANAQYMFANAPETAIVYVSGSASDFRNADGWKVLPISDEQLVTSNDLHYIINHTNYTATLTWDHYGSYYFNYSNIEGAVTIPSSVTVGGNEYMVKRIAKEALMYAFNITELTISDEVTTIDSAAFVNCGMTTLNLPAHIKTIPADMCHGMRNLTEIKIPDEVDTIKYNAFCGCRALSKLILPAGLKYIGRYAFDYCGELKRIYNYNPVPIVFDINDAATIFRNVPCADVTLFVPFGSKEAYQNALVWKDFYIEQFDPHEGINQPTSDSSLKGRGQKVIKDGQLYIERNGKTYNALGAELK